MSEPLDFKGRMGSGKPGGRLAYADRSLGTRYDFEKYLSPFDPQLFLSPDECATALVEGAVLRSAPLNVTPPLLARFSNPRSH